MLGRILAYTPGERSTFVGGLRAAGGLSGVWTIFLPLALLAASWLWTESLTLALLLLFPLAALVFGLRAALNCGSIKRSPQWELMMTTPMRLIDIYLARTCGEARSLFTLAVCLAVPLLLYGICIAGPYLIFWSIPAAAIWAHLVLFGLGATLTAGAIGMFRKSLTTCILSSFAACGLHLLISIVSIWTSGMAVWALAWTGIFDQIDGFGVWLAALLVALLTLIGPWHALKIGPGIVIAADRRRRGLRPQY